MIRSLGAACALSLVAFPLPLAHAAPPPAEVARAAALDVPRADALADVPGAAAPADVPGAAAPADVPGAAAPADPPGAAAPADAAARTLTLVPSANGASYRDGHGREVVLRGFNISGEVKLAENGNLPFADTADARESATALRESTGANAVRFLLSWERVQPAPDRIDHDYLRQVTEQIAAFADAGFWVLPDYHQDLYSRHLFRPDSWYTGDGAPDWVVDGGDYPPESCGICVHWGQNMMNNQAVKQAKADFWHDRRIPTEAGLVGVREAFLDQAEITLRHLATHLTPAQFQRVLGFDPMNEPHAGELDDGQDAAEWERDLLWPFFEEFRAAMDRAGWQDKPAYVEPALFWNNNVPFVREPGGFTELDALGTRYVFNAHFYHALAQSGLYGKARDGENSADFAEIRDRAADLGTTGFVSEFGHPLGGNTAEKFPTVLKGLYQGMDSRLPGADWWQRPAESGPVLSGTQWQWDVYHDRHHEEMNGNPEKVRTDADGWNGEDFSVVHRDDTGTLGLRADPRVLDRLYPRAVDGSTLAFSYEDRSRDGDTTLTWNRIPAALPALREVVGDGQPPALVWRDGPGTAPTELHLPATFGERATTVLSDLDADAVRRTEDSRLLLSAPDDPGAVHVALIANGPGAPAPDRLAAARAELTGWLQHNFPG
ncbi:cellulase family glycosylhydrolase [Saccharopolyspora sp. 7B]|uniref:cellulase family glycosylhydrolase n=1 Tax=Saccharopolyspora sp. 7B TaxID=2877240 RepID=UPI001CD206D4|nr:cellulase family glycosylhydrolase [Saccharopolyspora sp. 7B]MCA1282446.1 glycoside hydrolase family 5 protein [Saccharopolyspora sp. 7B]